MNNMKRAISLIVAVSMIFGLFAVMSPVTGAAEKAVSYTSFSDVTRNDWFYEYVMIASENGLVNGMGDGTFAPNSDITRAQFATILYRQLGSPDVAGLSNPFKDLSASWYKNAVIYMHSIGVINGMSKDAFGPELKITREQMVTMLWRIKHAADPSCSYYNATVHYADGKSVSSWAVDGMNWAIVEGIINGVGNNTLAPQGNATRAQAAKVMCLSFGLEHGEREPVTIRFWQSGGDYTAAKTTMRLLLDKFELQYPWITVEYEAIPWAEDPHTQIQIALADGDCADLLVLGSPLDFQLANEGELLPLNSLLTNKVLNDIPEMVKEQSKYYGSRNEDMYGKLMSIPLYSSNRALLYNKEIFDYFGVEYPTEGMSHADLLEMAKKVTGDRNGKKVYGYGTRATTSEQYLNFVWNYGAKIIDPYTMKAGTDSAAWKKGIEDYLAFYKAGVTPPGAIVMSGTDLFQMFLNEECAMFLAATDYAVSILENDSETDCPWSMKLGVAPLVGETYATCYSGADVLAVPATTAHPEETALLLNYLLSTEAQVLYTKIVSFYPTAISACKDPYFSEDPIMAGFAKAMEGAHPFDNYGVPGVGTILKDEIQKLIAGEITIEQYQANVTSRINQRAAEMFE